MKVMLTGVGSLVGKVVLDSLEGRRSGVTLIGVNHDPRSTGAARCDLVVPVPLVTDEAAYLQTIEQALDTHRPDVIIPCRDPEIAVLARWRDLTRPDAPVLAGPSELVDVMRDKLDSAAWARARDLPFAASILSGGPESLAQAEAMAAATGFPLIAKPRKGSGSKGVLIIQDLAQLRVAAARPSLVLQPFYDPPTPEELDLDLSAGLPLFWEVPVTRQYGGQFLLGPRGEVGPHMTFRATMRLGRAERVEVFPDPGLDDVLTRCAMAFRGAGWIGPMNLQARRDRDGWQVFEFGPRFSGGTSARLYLGLDEVGWLLNQWAGREVVAPWGGPRATRVERALADYPVVDDL